MTKSLPRVTLSSKCTSHSKVGSNWLAWYPVGGPHSCVQFAAIYSGWEVTRGLTWVYNHSEVLGKEQGSLSEYRQMWPWSCPPLLDTAGQKNRPFYSAPPSIRAQPQHPRCPRILPSVYLSRAPWPIRQWTVLGPWVGKGLSWGLLGLLPSTALSLAASFPLPLPAPPSTSLLWISPPPLPETRPGKGEGNYFCSRLGFPPSATGILPNRKISFTRFNTYLHICHVLPFPPAPSHWPLSLPPAPPTHSLHSFHQRLSLPANRRINT